jgi:cobalt-zinc-cadmium efflux system protein
LSQHHAHHHQSETHLKGKPLAIAIGLNLLITLAQVVGGILAGSLALIGDALHNFSDVLALVISYIANTLRGQKSTLQRTFGYKRAQILAALINALTLIGVSVYLIISAIGRLTDVQPVLSTYVIWLAVLGILVNGGSALLLTKLQKGDSNLRAAYLHLVADLATSFAVLLGGLAMYLYKVYWIDSAITILVSLYLILSAGKLFLHTIDVLMHFVPAEINVAAIANRLKALDGIAEIHHVHVWRLDDSAVHFEGHIRLTTDMPVSAFDVLKCQVEEVLYHEFGITHSSLQPEVAGCSDGEGLVARE